MDTLSSPIPNLQVPKSFTPQRHLKSTSFSRHHHSSSAAITTATSSISTLPQKDNFTPTLFPPYNNNNNHPQRRLHHLSPSTGLSPPRASVHRRAASGYAAALLEITQRNGTVLKVEKDVRRLLNLVFRNSDEQVREFMRDEFLEEKVKGQVVKEFVEKGKFEKQLVSFVNMLIDKNQSIELVKEVFQEFLSVFHQLIVVAQPKLRV